MRMMRASASRAVHPVPKQAAIPSLVQCSQSLYAVPRNLGYNERPCADRPTAAVPISSSMQSRPAWATTVEPAAQRLCVRLGTHRDAADRHQATIVWHVLAAEPTPHPARPSSNLSDRTLLLRFTHVPSGDELVLNPRPCQHAIDIVETLTGENERLQ